jgi:hypothetical protein
VYIAYGYENLCDVNIAYKQEKYYHFVNVVNGHEKYYYCVNIVYGHENYCDVKLPISRRNIVIV